jgi:23S rRNA U2552 (ribose-2'-O)-methylase RlmE/FtsJ
MTIVQVGWIEKEHSDMLTMKNKIHDFGSTDEWEIRKKLTNQFEAIYSGDEQFPSICSTVPLSRSYFKMVEMLKLSEFWSRVDSLSTPFISAHICEGPGGFLQHVVETVKKPVKSIHAMTLKPTKSHIPGWRRSFYFLRKHPVVKLEYGADDTGNVLKLENQTHFISQAKGSFLFTADGGFDFSIDYNKQEQDVFPLLLASFIIALQTLQEGGFCIIKIFDMYSDVTKDLLLGSASFFEDFTIYKPATSRPCNAERYFIGRGYLGVKKAQRWIFHLLDAQKRIQTSLIPLTRLFLIQWPQKLQDLMQEQIEWQERLQMKSIYDTLNLDKKNILHYVESNLKASKEWCQTFGQPMFSYFHQAEV